MYNCSDYKSKNLENGFCDLKILVGKKKILLLNQLGLKFIMQIIFQII